MNLLKAMKDKDSMMNTDCCLFPSSASPARVCFQLAGDSFIVLHDLNKLFKHFILKIMVSSFTRHSPDTVVVGTIFCVFDVVDDAHRSCCRRFSSCISSKPQPKNFCKH